ncbi:MAG: RNA polymerase factor sigma-54 [Muribaculaceae bacterium]|nr:RNA polymerase factor sigma-54 [Muribaculaceae bacterium]
MGENLRLEQQLALQQRLNPQNVALGRVLEMSVPEFEDEVRRELDDNPALETVEPTAEEPEEYGESAEQMQMADYADADDTPTYFGASNYSADERHDEVASYTADEDESMGEILMRRLTAENELDEDDMRIASHIIGNIDDNGYLTRPLRDIADDIAISEGFYVDDADVRRVFDDIRKLDPAGICAVDLRDCLLLQLERMPQTVESITAREIVAHHFDLFSKRHFDRLQAQLDIPRPALADAIDIIQGLNPKPASALEGLRTSDRVQHVVPDFVLDYDAATDTFTVGLQGNIPELAIESSFRADDPGESATPRQKQAHAFIRDKRNAATAFIKLVELRARTLMMIARAIVKLQHDFFVSGDKADIKPMILRDVSTLTGLDISVISRATSGKYILTPHGMYPLKLLFNERPDADNDVSAHQILKVLDDIISSEDKHSPLSDQALTEALMARGYDIARRTVAKYRERLGHPVARLRKEL